MSASIADPKARATTITLYTDMDAVRNSLNFTDTSTVRLLLIDREGKVYWEDTGAFSKAKLQGLEAVLASL
jgi:predicted transcriptional regulator